MCQNTEGYPNDQVTSKSCCIPPGSYTLTCKDLFGDGWDGGFIEILGTKYCDDCRSGCKEITKQITIGKFGQS